jgi:tetratricopeptide (TPR) repeat protein
VKHLIHNVADLEVVGAAVEVNEASRGEKTFFVEHETYAPAAAFDRLPAMPAFRLGRRRLLRAVNTRKTPVTQAVPSETLERFFVADVGRVAESLQQRLRAFVGGANRVVPVLHFALGKRIGKTLTEAQRSPLDGSRAAATFGSPARRDFENVGHREKHTEFPQRGPKLTANRGTLPTIPQWKERPVAGILPYGADVHDQLCSGDPEAADAALEIKACLTEGEISKALVVCDRMLLSHPDNRLFEGLRLEVENREREVRLESVRRLSSEVENIPDLDARIDTIQQTLQRYPSESQLSQLLKNATARRDLFNVLITEARDEESADRYGESLRRWYLIRELHPTMPGLQNEIHRVEALADSQRRMRRRAEFVDAIFRLSSTGDYAHAVYQCINALAEYPDDGGLLALKSSIEEKAQHATKLQGFITEGLTFLQGHEVDAALESFAKASSLDPGNLQVRYLIGIALLEKARVTMDKDRERLNVLLDEARGFITAHPELHTLSIQPSEPPAENSDSLIQVDAPPPAPIPEVVTPLTQAPPQNGTVAKDPIPIRKPASFGRIALFGLVLFIAFFIGWLIMQPQSGSVVNPPPASVDIQVTPAGAEIFVDSQKVGDSQVRTEITRGSHIVSASLAGYDSQTFPMEFGSEPKTLQIDLRPTPLNVHIVTDQPGGTVWIDDQIQGDVTEGGITIPGVEPGVRIVKVSTPAGDIEVGFQFSPGKMPTPTTLPSRQLANVLFAGSADGRSRVECNCVPAGLRVGDISQMIRAGGLEIPILEGQQRAELWLGKNRKELTILGSRSPAATIAVFSQNVHATEPRIESSAVNPDHQQP